MSSPIRWPAEAIWEAVAPRLPGFTVEVLPQIDSTNSELMRRLRAGQAEPVLLVAEQQTAGRGRLGRHWLSDQAATTGPSLASLTFSLALPLAPADWSGLSLAVGVSVAESLHPAIGLKWPNDLWWQDRKLGGILIETTSVGAVRHAVIGVGLNITEPAVPTAEEPLRTPAAWLQALAPDLDAPQALQRLAAPLVEAVLTFEAQGFAPFARRFQARDVLRDRPVLLSDGTPGTALGVDSQGALRVRTTQGVCSVSSAEVSVRPAPPEKD